MRLPFGMIFSPRTFHSPIEIEYLLQVFAFDPESQRVSVCTDVFATHLKESESAWGTAYKVAHYGTPSQPATLSKVRTDGCGIDETLDQAIGEVYRQMVVKEKGERLTMRRKLLLGYSEETFDALLNGPGRCFGAYRRFRYAKKRKLEDELHPVKSRLGEVESRLRTSGEIGGINPQSVLELETVRNRLIKYLEDGKESGEISLYSLPSWSHKQPIAPGMTTACRIEFQIEGENYNRLVDDDGYVEIEGQARIARDIQTYDMDERWIAGILGPYFVEYGFRSPVKGHDFLVFPRDYFEDRSVDITVAPKSFGDRDVDNKVLWFSGTDNDEWDVRLGPKEKGRR